MPKTIKKNDRKKFLADSKHVTEHLRGIIRAAILDCLEAYPSNVVDDAIANIAEALTWHVESDQTPEEFEA